MGPATTGPSRPNYPPAHPPASPNAFSPALDNWESAVRFVLKGSVMFKHTTGSANQLTFFPPFFEVGWVGSEAEDAGLLALEPPAVGLAQPSAGREGQHLPARSNKRGVRRGGFHVSAMRHCEEAEDRRGSLPYLFFLRKRMGEKRMREIATARWASR